MFARDSAAHQARWLTSSLGRRTLRCEVVFAQCHHHRWLSAVDCRRPSVSGCCCSCLEWTIHVTSRLHRPHRVFCSRLKTRLFSHAFLRNPCKDGRPGLRMAVRRTSKSCGRGLNLGLYAVRLLCLWRTASLQLQMPLVALWKCYAFTLFYFFPTFCSVHEAA